MNIYVCGAYGPRMGVYIFNHWKFHLHAHLLFITRRFLLTVKQTEKHLCALTVNRLYVNWRYSCSSIGNGAFVRHTASSSGTSSQFRGSRFTVQVFGFLKFTFEDEKDCRQGCIQGHRTICTAEMAFFTSHATYHQTWRHGSTRTEWWYHCTRDQ